VRARYERGVRSPLDVRLAAANEAAARAGVAARQSQLAAATRQLEILLGRYPAGAVTNLSELPAPAAPVPAGLPGELLERRPDLVAAERRLAASSARAAEARAALLPRLALTGTAGRTSAELEDLLDNSFSLWSIAANLAQPLYQGGRLRANVRLAEARAREATEQYLATVLRAFGEVEAALHDEQQLARREAELAEAVVQSRAAQRLAEDRYASGLEPLLTLLEAQRRAWEAESQWLAVRRARLDNRIQLHLALGGGFGAVEGAASAAHSSPNLSSR
jgi:NodT family efflux transporter outer membrane factor (OMF) lipoprotein